MASSGEYMEECLRRVTHEEEGSLSKSTKRAYASKINVLKEWLAKHHPSLLDDTAKFGVKCPISELVLKAFVGHLLPGAEDETAIVIGDDDGSVASSTKKAKPIGPSTLGNYLSALTYLYKENGIEEKEASRLTRGLLKKCLAGVKRSDAELRQKGELPAMEGKAPLTFTGYDLIARYAISSGTSSYAWLYVVLCWNLISRSNNVGNLMFEHISWKGDALIVFLPKTKGDQEGENAFPRHLYANPENAAVCPVLALAVHVFSASAAPPSARLQVFQMSNPQAAFSNWLTELWKKIEEEETEELKNELTAVDGGVGSHSFRKGGATYALGFPGGPTSVSVYLRAAWSLGTTQSRYIFIGDGGDQFVGRVLAGLPITDKKFSALPPIFKKGVSISDACLESYLPNYRRYHENFRPVLPYLVASLQHHYNWLKRTLPESHPLRTSFIWRSGYLNDHGEDVDVEYGSSSHRTLTATGVPLPLVTALEVSKLSGDFAVWKTAVAESVANLSTEISALNQSLPKEVMDLIFSNLSINGAVALTESKLREAISNLESRLLNRVENLVERLGSAANTTQPNQSTSHSSSSASAFGHFVWGSRAWNPFPEHYVIPSCTVQSIWHLWFRGDLSTGIYPFRRIISKLHIKGGNIQKFSRVKAVIQSIIVLVERRHPGLNADGIFRLDDEALNRVFEEAFQDLLKLLHDADVEHRADVLQTAGHVPKKRRLEDRNSGIIKYNTIYKELKELDINLTQM